MQDILERQHNISVRMGCEVSYLVGVAKSAVKHCRKIGQFWSLSVILDWTAELVNFLERVLSHDASFFLDVCHIVHNG